MEDEPRDNGLDRLFAEARRAGLYDPGVENGFETRLMARLRTRREGRTPFLFWAWRLIPVFTSIVILLGIWTYISESKSNQRVDLSAVASIGNEETMLAAYLAGR